MKQRIGSSQSRMALALMFIVSLLSALFVVNAPDASAATSVDQCNSEHNIAGQAIECSYTVTNTVNGSATSSRVVATHCHGAANDPPTMVCSSDTSTSTDLVTSISQCNYAGDGGGGTMKCTVDIVNNITGTEEPLPATVNQCNGSADGSGVQSCSPYPASTTGAPVTQCNDSGNGGGSTVTCTVDPDSTTTSVLAVSINQCNNSENGGGSTVHCRAGLTNNVTPADDGTNDEGGTDNVDDGHTNDDDNKAGDGDGDTDNADGGDKTGGGDTDKSGDDTTGDETTGKGTPVVDTNTAIPDDRGTPDAGITLTQVTRVPSGGASTGGGSASGIENARLLLLGVVLVALSVPALAIGRRVSARH